MRTRQEVDRVLALHCEGIQWRPYDAGSLSVAKRKSVAPLDELAESKR
jgi:hypothetical protein